MLAISNNGARKLGASKGINAESLSVVSLGALPPVSSLRSQRLRVSETVRTAAALWIEYRTLPFCFLHHE